MIESTIAGPQTRTAGPFNATHGSEHLFIRGKSIISSLRWSKCIGQMRKLAYLNVTLTWLVICLRYIVVLSALDFFIHRQFWETATSLCN